LGSYEQIFFLMGEKRRALMSHFVVENLINILLKVMCVCVFTRYGKWAN